MVPAPLRSSRMPDRIVVDRRRDESGEQGGLGQGDLERLLAEVRLGRGLDPVRAVAEVHRVQVPGEDPVLTQTLLELPREIRLADLAPDRLLVPDVELLDELLRDRRAALDHLAGRGVDVRGSQQRAQVEAGVIVEALVLDRDHRVADHVGDLRGTDEHPVLPGVQGGDQRTVGRVDERRLRERVRVLTCLPQGGEIAGRNREGEHEQADHEGPRASGHGSTILPRVEPSHLPRVEPSHC